MIDGKGYRGRTKLRAMWDDERPIDPQYIALAKFLFTYAYGTPGKMQAEGEKRKSLGFVTTTDLLPWDERMENPRPVTDRMIAQKAEEERLQLEAAKRPAEAIDVTDKNDTEPPETLEVVDVPEQFGPGRGR